MSREHVFPRALEVHALLKKGKRVTSKIVAEMWDISDRHASRAINFLRDEMNAPLVYDSRRKTFVYTEECFDLPAVIMTEGEAIGVILAHEALLRRQGTPLTHRLQQAIGTLRKLLPKAVSVDVESLMDRVLFSPMPTRLVADDVLDTCASALEKHKTLRIEYYSPTGDEHTNRDINVYHLAHVRGDWYAVAWCCLRQGMRTFALSRVREIQLLDHEYTIPATFSIADYFRDALGVHAGTDPQDVVLDFLADSARWVRERVWHPSQTLEPLDDGRLRLRMRVSLSMEIVRWILSWGGHVEVLQPPELRESVAAEVRTMASTYQ